MVGSLLRSSAGLAERTFESKRRDFQRFLERVKRLGSQSLVGFSFDGQGPLQIPWHEGSLQFFSSLFQRMRSSFLGSPATQKRGSTSMPRFRRFCSNWLHVFEADAMCVTCSSKGVLHRSHQLSEEGDRSEGDALCQNASKCKDLDDCGTIAEAVGRHFMRRKPTEHLRVHTHIEGSCQPMNAHRWQVLERIDLP